jgi:predicted Zn-dependent protease
MRCKWRFLGLFLLLGLGMVSAQEEGSSELFTESYTDQFQEAFFEALKQKGIENYDRSEALMLEAKKYDPSNPVVDYEMARILILAQDYNRALPYALTALQSNPSQYWYLDTFMEALKPQRSNIGNYSSELPLDLPAFRLNLARWYMEKGMYTKAKSQLETITGERDATGLLEEISLLESKEESKSNEKKQQQIEPSVDSRSVVAFESRLEGFVASENWKALEDESARAIESFPLQPYFYFCQGLSLLRQGRAEEAVISLREGEDYLLEHSETSQNIYRALAEAYTAIGEPEKAKKYQDKLKSGL